jgi:hypothetical protein
VDEAVRAAFPHLPERFTRRQVCDVLGYQPERTALYRSLGKLTQDGWTRVEESGGGKRATVYRKTGGGDPTAQE